MSTVTLRVADSISSAITTPTATVEVVLPSPTASVVATRVGVAEEAVGRPLTKAATSAAEAVTGAVEEATLVVAAGIRAAATPAVTLAGTTTRESMES